MEKINDAVFGELTPDPKNGEIIVQYKGIEYQIESSEYLPKAHQIASELERYTTQAKAFAAKSMLERKNNNWVDKDADGNNVLLTSEQFIEHMTLESISVDETLSTFWFNDGQLFLGHMIAVEHDGHNWTDSSIQG